MRFLSVASVLVLATACSGGGGTDDSDSAPLTSDIAACEMYQQANMCPECADGDVTCTFEGTSVTEMSCGGCQARAELLRQLCEAEEPADEATIDAGMTCDPPQCVVWYDGCSDPCTPQCVPTYTVPDSTCDMACATTPAEPEGTCTWDHDSNSCQFLE